MIGVQSSRTVCTLCTTETFSRTKRVLKLPKRLVAVLFWGYSSGASPSIWVRTARRPKLRLFVWDSPLESTVLGPNHCNWTSAIIRTLLGVGNRVTARGTITVVVLKKQMSFFVHYQIFKSNSCAPLRSFHSPSKGNCFPIYSLEKFGKYFDVFRKLTGSTYSLMIIIENYEKFTMCREHRTFCSSSSSIDWGFSCWTSLGFGFWWPDEGDPLQGATPHCKSTLRPVDRSSKSVRTWFEFKNRPDNGSHHEPTSVMSEAQDLSLKLNITNVTFAIARAN